MRRRTLLVMAAVFGSTAYLALADATFAKTLPAYVTAALNDAGRTDADRAQDADRKPGEMVVFAGIKPGMKVVDLIPGQGYFTRIFAKAVGDKGYVYAYLPSNLDEYLKKRLNVTEITTEFLQHPYLGYGNVSVLHAAIEKFSAPELVD